jgi:DNA (cytosine-5)-methyltransferase 1
MKNPKLLDLFCGAGGASMGYHRAGFEVEGVDIKPQPHYPFKFYQADALAFPLEGYDVYHASPPCQLYSLASVVHRNNGKEYPDLIAITRFRLVLTGKPFIIENVPPAAKFLFNPITLCGVMFDLRIFRHRCFETTFSITPPEHSKHNGKIGDGKYFSVAGGAGRWKSWGTVYRNVSKGTREQWRQAMGIDWMLRKELTQAIPPAYTEYIGKFLMEALNREVKI